MPPEKYDVESQTVSVQCGTAVLPIHDDGLADKVDEDCPVKDGIEFDADLKEPSSSFCKSSPISTRVSVSVSISAIRGTGTSTAFTKLSTTCTAQLRSLAAFPIRPVSPEIKLLSEINLLNLLSETWLLFLFVFEQLGSAGDLTPKLL